jgi:hypothetical protein
MSPQFGSSVYLMEILMTNANSAGLYCCRFRCYSLVFIDIQSSVSSSHGRFIVRLNLNSLSDP